MKRKPRYKDAPKDVEESLERAENITAQFNARFPLPSQLVQKEETVKVTLALNESSVIFFKKEAKKHNVPYQRMIKNLLEWYRHNWQRA